MANPLASNNPQNGGNSMGNGPLAAIAGLIPQYQDFRRGFKGDPEQITMNLINSGKMTRNMFNQCVSIANVLQGFLH